MSRVWGLKVHRRQSQLLEQKKEPRVRVRDKRRRQASRLMEQQQENMVGDAAVPEIPVYQAVTVSFRHSSSSAFKEDTFKHHLAQITLILTHRHTEE